MPPNNNLRTVIAQCRNFSTRSRGKLSSSRSNNGARRRVVASGGGSKFDGLKSSITFGNIAFACWGIFEMLEYRRTVREKRGRRKTSMPRDLLNWLFNE